VAVSVIDPRPALLVIDLQKGLLGYRAVETMEVIAARAGRLAAALRRRGLPVVLVRVVGRAPGRTQVPAGGGAAGRGGVLAADAGEFLPALGQEAGDHVVEKRSWDAFAGTGLEAWLRGQGVTQVVVAGVATGSGVESTARSAHALGFDVVLAVDAMTDASAEVHAHAIERVFPRLGECGTVEEIEALLG
jgi:nicotinamidase-related amidase